jgi:hypothetical protein
MKQVSVFFFGIILFSSCNSEEPAQKAEKVEKQQVDTLPSEDTIAINKVLPRKRLSKHAGSWIADNLDNTEFYSQRVDEWVEKSGVEFEEPQEAMDSFDYLKKEDLSKLNVREVIYYGLAYPSSFSQICADSYFEGDKNNEMIRGYSPTDYESEVMSELQSGEIMLRRDSVIYVLRNYIKNNPDRIDEEYLDLLLRLEAYEAIPEVIETASDKNMLNYTFLLLLMHRAEVDELRKLDFHDQLYGEQSYETGNRIPATIKNKKAIIKLAKAYYSEVDGE